LQSYEARFKLKNDDQKDEADEFSPDENDIETGDEKAILNGNNTNERKLSWAERKLHWFNKRQNKRAMIITSSVLMLVGALGLIITSAIRFSLVRA